MVNELAALRVLLLTTLEEGRQARARFVAGEGLVGPTVFANPDTQLESLFIAGRLNVVLAFLRPEDPPDAFHWLRRLRASSDMNVALAPVFAIQEEVTLRRLQRFLAAGMDDILVAPLPPGRLAQRVEAAIRRPLPYYRTVSYFGPDRRRMPGPPSPVAQERRGSGSAVLRIEVERDPVSGCRIRLQTLVEPEETGMAEAAVPAIPTTAVRPLVIPRPAAGNRFGAQA